MYYFAYGINLNRGQMAKCCPAARPRFSATLPNYQLVFAGWSREWRGGVATIRRAGKEKVLGGVYQISEQDVLKLDRYEGYPARSDKMKILVFRDTGDAVEAFTYITKSQEKEASPSAEYLDIIRKAYLEWSLV